MDRLPANHTAFLEGIVTAAANLQALAGGEGDFQAGMVSEKVTAALDLLKGSLLPLVNEVFTTSETSISSFAQTLVHTDMDIHLKGGKK